MDKSIFPSGIMYKLPSENAPEFVKGKISIKVDEFIQYLKENENNGWVNLDFLKSKGGKLYFKLNDWKPKTDNKVGQTVEDVAKLYGGKVVEENGVKVEEVPF